MSREPWLDGVAWPLAPARAKLRVRKRIAGADHDNYERLALTMKGVVLRPKDDAEGLSPDSFATYQVVEPDQLLFKLIDLENRATSRVGLVPQQGIVSSAYIAASCRDWLPRYGFYFFTALYNEGIFNVLGSGVRSTLTPDDLLTLTVPAPDVRTQHEVCAYLDHETGEIDAFIADQERLIALLIERRASTIEHVVHSGTRDGGSDLSLDEDYDGAGIRPLKTIARFTGGATPSTDEDKYWTSSGGTPWVSISDFQAIAEGRPVQKSLTEEGMRAGRLRPSTEPTILFAMYASVGATVVLRTSAVWNQAIVGITPLPMCSLKYLAYVLQGARPTLGSLFRSNTQDNLNLEQVRNLPIPIPTGERQKRIVEILDAETTAIDDAITDAREVIALSKERRAALITAAVTGQVHMIERKRALV